jgi:hypothetical protein
MTATAPRHTSASPGTGSHTSGLIDEGSRGTDKQMIRVCLVVLGLMVSGCVNCKEIMPTELPKLNNSFEKPIDSEDGRLVAVRVASVQTPSGHLIQVKGEYDVCVTLVSGDDRTFRHPVVARLEGDVLLIESRNWKPKTYDLSAVQSVEVCQ